MMNQRKLARLGLNFECLNYPEAFLLKLQSARLVLSTETVSITSIKRQFREYCPGHFFFLCALLLMLPYDALATFNWTKDFQGRKFL